MSSNGQNQMPEIDRTRCLMKFYVLHRFHYIIRLTILY
uniref:Uncharacterized protein n=1 Tax=Zea mays TaxID=4577 RepID=B6T0R4_MAIZE|nr:hypothetical protein [Zea mays]